MNVQKADRGLHPAEVLLPSWALSIHLIQGGGILWVKQESGGEASLVQECMVLHPGVQLSCLSWCHGPGLLCPLVLLLLIPGLN